MNAIVQLIKLISKLPLSLLYGFADLIFVLSYYLVGYRKKVVSENLHNAFPEKSEQERKAILKAFFRHFADYIVETFKSLTISSHELRVRMQHLNQHVFQEAKDEGKNIIFLSGHIFNWEWISALAKVIPQEHCYPVYRKIKNPFWNKQIENIRNRFGNQSVDANEVMRHILRTPNDGNHTYMFVADQSPHYHISDIGLEFLNQKTPVFLGYDKLATRMDLAFIYCDIKKIKRGFYQVNYYRIHPDGEKFQTYEVVKKFHQMLENTLKRDPSNYLWSHRRWKYADLVKKIV
ncbi:lysophospholipid acyltransferase family protein [Bergeyella sp. RCAD1439]|uniref:lysophospholipid acyltransferase family protein n=1 Tax=Bergeyella anatis TaxID=3113737 RepID=UPI002E18EE02|nr:lipid A biosynthesis acyltransferase [Bergeyella sp. RCAD1439]